MPIRPEKKGWYPANWKDLSQRIRFERAQGKCEWCGIAHGTPLPMKCCAQPAVTDKDPKRCASCGKPVPTVVLTTAHIEDREDDPHAEDNLAALCQKCHNGHDAKARAAGIRERREAASGQLRLDL